MKHFRNIGLVACLVLLAFSLLVPGAAAFVLPAVAAIGVILTATSLAFAFNTIPLLFDPFSFSISLRAPPRN